jgi:AAA domain
VKEDANSIHVEHGADALRSRFDVAVQVENPVANGAAAPSTEKRSNGKRPLRFTLFADIDPAPRKVFLVEGLLGAGETSSFVGMPGSGKSVLAGDLACHVAGDVSWLGRRVSKGAVLYVAAERVKLTERRFAAFRKYHRIDKLPLALVSGAVNMLSNQEHVVEIAGYAANLKEKTKLPIVLIVIDTVSRVLCGGDENSPKDMGAFVANVAQLQEVTGAHVLLIHHVPQDGNVRLRGHGALLGSLDTVVAIEKAGAIRTATVQKDNDGVEDRQIAFDLKSISLSIDPDTQEETTAPVVIPAEGADLTAAPSRIANLSKSAKIGLRALQKAVAECGAVPPASNHVPPEVKTVTIDQWRDYAYRTGISTSDKAHAKGVAFNRASGELAEARKIGIWDPHVWTV